MALNLSQIVAAIMAITGIVMMAYADGFHGDSFVGVALAVGSASTSALYKVRASAAISGQPCLFACSNKLGSLPPLRCCSRCSWAAPTSEKWPTSFQPWGSSILSSSPACPSFSISPRWSTGALCHHCPGDTCVDWQDCGWVRLHTGGRRSQQIFQTLPFTPLIVF